MPADCRVRKLHIRTYDKTLLPRMAFVIEDAFRTASYPGVPPNGIVYIRKLSLGKHFPSTSSRVLSGKIDEQLRLIRPVKIVENMQEDPSASAVWFADELSPHRFIIYLLSKNNRPTAWYWSAAIRGWSSKLTLQQSYHLIFSYVSEHITGIRGMSFVLEPLIAEGRVHEVLQSFDSREIAILLRNMGIRQFSEVNQNECLISDEEQEAFTLTPFLCELIIKAVRMWSAFDPRTLLISSMALVNMGKNPNPLNINRLFEAVSELEILPHKPGSSVSEKVTETFGKNRIAIPKDSIPKDSIPKDSQETVHRGLSGPASERPPIAAPEKETEDIIQNQKQEYTEAADYKIPLAALEKGSTEKVQKQRNLVTVSMEKTEYHETGKQIDDHEEGLSPVGAEQEKLIQKMLHEQRKTDDKSFTPYNEHTLKEVWPSFGGFAGDFSEYAGLVFIVSLMKRLGMDALMEMYPDYRELKIPQRIIFRCAELLNISYDNPVLNFAGEKPEESNKTIGFTAPPEWGRILNPSSSNTLQLRLGRMLGKTGCRLILDDKKRLVIGVWNSQNRILLEPWFNMTQKAFGHAAPQNWSVQALVNNVICAMNRYLRMYARMGLFGLIRRPAYIATTNTHLDLTIPFKQLDIRVRMAGLDINPGWVPWLGKVIQFHYVGGEY